MGFNLNGMSVEVNDLEADKTLLKGFVDSPDARPDEEIYAAYRILEEHIGNRQNKPSLQEINLQRRARRKLTLVDNNLTLSQES